MIQWMLNSLLSLITANEEVNPSSYKVKLVNIDNCVINKIVYPGLDQLNFYSEENNITGNEIFISLNMKEKMCIYQP